MNVIVNGISRAYPEGLTLDRLVATLIPSGSRAGGPRGVAAAVNGTVVPRGTWPGAVLADGDRVEVLSAVQGG
ncbi:sulfur carrier protein ThiS [Streptomyces sp. SL13]|uniref:Sulfur carrier protein ThiS n=1 Tax=Streptantibioticus silvisoli TaxID=2705255 RepID=A0AA90H2P9_9ACTN|nr:sulfur carrier protein ThiS [Streptantibioticus silvisoli]MDI5963565.1 sulfur carrier protein ThiS [Streptantibioticus silvisoli]MDI5970231.1 sulfur carrier protein ThiS [Streptantibioticus silvisoli]